MGTLDGIKVLDFGRYVAGPYCATLLADFGADVIRVERVGGGEDRNIAPVTPEGEGALFMQINRNKRSLTLDPRSPDSAQIIRKLVEQADVVVVNVPPSALPKMGLDYATLSAIKPDIILANISSFGPNGPWADRPGFDSVGQAMCGSAYLSGSGDQPYRTPITWVDHATAVYAAFGIMVALFERARSGKGQQVDGSLLGSAMAFSATFLIEQALAAPNRTAIGNRSFLNGPTDTFRTRDGWIVTQVVGDPIFRRWTKLMEEPHWLEDPRFATDELRGINGEILSERMAAWCAPLTSQEALERLSQASIPAGPVLSPQEAVNHPQAQAMNFFVPTAVPGLDQAAPLMRLPLDMSASPATIRSSPPQTGEHTDQILQEIGFSAEQIGAFRENGAV
jgi:crotonobetainyl-CoA:carnitine CoA-transferase CaiB-like acyl-CoA transferase